MGNRLIEGLKTGQRYIVQVRAKDSAGAFGAYSDVVEITTSTEVIPRTPTSVVLAGTVEKWVGAKYKTTLTLTWVAPVETIVSKYEAILEEYSGGAWAVADVANAEAYPATTATEQKWTDYTPSGQYRARIRAISKGNTIGTWSGYATCTLSFTSDLPTPTGLALKQDGKKITASVTAVSQATYPQLAGYRYYASKQTAFTPGATNLVGEPKSNKLTFQEAYDSGDGIIEEIDIADTIYVRVSCFDAAGNESTKCAEVSILAGGAVPDAPTFDGSHKLVLTPTRILGRVYNIKTDLKWIAPTNVELGGYEVEIYNALDGGGTLEKTLSPAKGTTQCAYTDSDPNTDYSARIRAINKWGRIGTWSAYSNASGTIIAQNTPTPTGLALKQDGKKVSATVDRFSLATYPDVKRYKFYAAKGTGFTPGTANLVGDAQSNTCTFQEAANAGTGVLEEIAIGNTIYVRVATADANERIGTACAEVSVVAGGAVPDAPASVTLTLTVTTFAGKIYNIKSASAWTPPANVELSGYEQEIYNAANGGGTLQKTLSPAKSASASNWTDSDPDTAYSTRIRAINKWGRIGTWSSWANASALGDTTAPADPTGVVLNSTTSIFEIKVAKNTEADMHEYIIYVNTSTSAPTKGDTEHIIKRMGHPTTRSTLPLGAKTEAGTNIITLTTGVPYYFWVTAADVAHNESALVATTPTNATVTPGVTVDITAPTPNPPTGMSSSITVQYAGLATRMQAKLSWTACTDDSTRPVHYHVLYWKTGETSNVISAIAYTNSYTIRNLDPSLTYYWKVAAEDWYNNITNYCSDQTLTVADDTVAPTAPTVGTITSIGGTFRIPWIRRTEANIHEYILYIYTSDSVANAKAIQNIAHPRNSATVMVGDKSIDASITVASNTDYYFWLSTKTVSGVESATKTQFAGGPFKANRALWFTPGSLLQHDGGTTINLDHLADGINYFRLSLANKNLVVSPPNWLKSHGRPWKMSGLSVTKYSAGVNETVDHAIPSGKVGWITAFHLHSVGTSCHLGVIYGGSTYNLCLTALGAVDWQMNINTGMYLKAGDSFHLHIGNTATQHGWMMITEFDADTDITPVFFPITDTITYTVTASKLLTLTWAGDYAGDITNTILAGTDELLNIGGGDGWWNLTKGVIQAPAGTILKTSAAGGGYCFGIESVL